MILLKKHNFQKAVLNEVTALSSNIEASKDGLFIAKFDMLTNSALQTIFCDKKINPVSSKIIRPIILESCVKAEEAAGGAGEICLKYLTELLPSAIQLTRSSNNFDINELLDNDFKNIISYIKTIGERSSKKSVQKHINDINADTVFKELIEKAVLLAGKSARITLEKSTQEETKIIIKNGCNFDVSVNASLLGTKSKWEKSSANCFVVDGFIEEVSEIHHLLEKASETGEPYVIFARDFSPEVLSTVSFNLKRGTIDVLLVKVSIDEENLNALVDIAVVCGTDVVSSYKGETISASIRREMCKVDKIICRSHSVTIENTKTKNSKEAHINRIKSQLNEKNDQRFSIDIQEEKRKLINNRISRLFSETIIVSVGKEFTGNYKDAIEKLDSAFRELKSHTQVGYIQTARFLSYENHDISSSCIKNVLKTTEREVIPVTSIVFATKFAHSAVKSICSVEAVLFYN
jgi:chaperonin GroEL (HSP60 family)